MFIVWARFNRRAELLAQRFGASLHYVYHGRKGHPSQAPMRYLVQAWRTWSLLRRERPDLVFVQNPPIFAVLVVSIYSRCYGAQYVIDSHTGAFRSSKWRWSVGLHHLLSRGALTTVVHNESQGRLVERWGCSYAVVGFTGGEYPRGEPYPLSEKFNVAVICGFEADEPLDIVFEAAGLLTGVCFYITGDARRINRHLLRKMPGNIRLTGHLSYERYVGLLRGVGAVIDLVDDEHTLLMGGFEAVALGIPLIVSDWPLLRDYFSRGTIYVPNTAEGVCDGIRRVQQEGIALRQDVLLLKKLLHGEWIRKAGELQRLLRENMQET